MQPNINSTPKNFGINPDLYTINPNGKSQKPQNTVASKIPSLYWWRENISLRCISSIEILCKKDAFPVSVNAAYLYCKLLNDKGTLNNANITITLAWNSLMVFKSLYKVSGKKVKAT